MAGATNSVVDVKIRIGAEGQDVLVQVNKGLGDIEGSAKRASSGVRELSGASGDLNPKLADTDRNTRQASTGADGMSRSFGGLPAILGAVAGALAALKLAEVAKDCIMAAARVETLGVALYRVGANQGYTNAQMDAFVSGVQKSGISALESRASVLRLAEANIDLTKSAQLARAAQDAAVIANTTSADALERISTAIATGQSILNHHMGLMTNFEGAYISAAHAVGKTSAELTEAEKSEVRLNETLRAAQGIAGTYEAAMGTAGKQINSFNRYISDLQVAVGKAFGPALTSLVDLATQKMGQFTDLVKSSPVQSILSGIGGAVVFVAQNLNVLATILAVAGAAWLAYQVQLYAAVIATTAAQLASMGLGGALAGMLVAAIYAAGYAWVQFTAWLAANPLVALALVIGGLVVAMVAMTKSTSDYLAEARKGSQELADSGRAYASAKTEITSLDGALRKFDEAMQLANGNHHLELAAVQELAGRYPLLVGTYDTVGQALDNINAKRAEYLAGLEREAEVKEVELKEKARQKIVEVGQAVGVLALKQRDYQQALDAQSQSGALWNFLGKASASFQDVNDLIKATIAQMKEVRDANAINPSNIEDGKAFERTLEGVLAQLSKIKGVAPEVQKALELALRPQGRDKISEMIRQAGPISDEADLVGEMIRRPMPKKTAEQVAGEWQKAHAEAQTLGKAPSEAARLAAQEEYKAYDDEFKRLFPGVAENIRALKLAEAGKTAVAERSAYVKSEYEIGQVTTQALMESLRQRQAVLAGGNIVERTEAARLQKEITGLELKESETRIAAAEREFQQKMKGDEITTRRYQKELELVKASTLPYEQKAALIATLEEQITAVQITNRAKATAQMEEVYNRERTLIQNSALSQEEKAAKLIALDNKVQENRLALAAKQEKLEEARIKAAEEYAKVEGEVTKTLLTDKGKALYELDQRYQKYYLALEDYARREGKDAQWLADRKLMIQTAYLKEYELLNLSTLGKLLKAWTDTDKLMVDGTAEALKSIQNGWTTLLTKTLTGELKTFDDFWKGFLDMMINAWANMLAQLISAWTMSGLAKIIAGTFNINLGNTNPVNVGLGGGGGGILGTVSSGFSLVNAAKTVGSWLGISGAAAGLGGASGFAGPLAAEQQAEVFATMIENGKTTEEALAAINGNGGLLGGVMGKLKGAFDTAIETVKGFTSSTEVASAVTEAASATASVASETSVAAFEAMEAGAMTATEAEAMLATASTASTSALGSIAAVAGPVGIALGAVSLGAKLMGMPSPIEAVLAGNQGHTQASATQYIKADMDYLFRATEIERNGLDRHALGLDKGPQSLVTEDGGSIGESLREIDLLAERAGLTQKQITNLMKGVGALQTQLAVALKNGDQQLAASLERDIEDTKKLAAATGMSADGFGQMGFAALQVNRILQGLAGSFKAMTQAGTDNLGELQTSVGGMESKLLAVATAASMPESAVNQLKDKFAEMIQSFYAGDMTIDTLAVKMQQEFVSALIAAAQSGSDLTAALEAIPNIDRYVNIHFQNSGQQDFASEGDSGEQHHHGGWAGDGLVVRRFHSGGWPGLRQDEIPAILQRGEPVFSLDEVQRLGGREVIEALRQGRMPVIQTGRDGGGDINIERMESHVHVAGDVVGEASALDRVKAAATKGVLTALAKKKVVGDDPQVKHQLRTRV